MPKPGLPPRNFTETYRYDELAGHDPRVPWWASLLGVAAVLALVLVIIGLAIWF